MEEYTERTSSLDYLLVFMLLCLSGNLLVVGVGPYLQLGFIGSFILLTLIYVRKGAKRNKEIFVFISVWLSIYLFQLLGGIFLSFNTAFFYLIKLLIGVYVFVILGSKFREVYFRVMYFLAITSLFFFIANVLGFHFSPIATYGDRSSIFLYTQFYNKYEGTLLLRNSGMFWEPGAFQGYINMMFLFYLPELGDLWKKHKIKMLTIVIALITTFSTTGYIAFGIIILAYTLFYKKGNKVYSYLLFFVLLISSIYLFLTLDFLGKKVGIVNNTTVYESQIGGNRVANLSDNWLLIKESLIFGHGYSQDALKFIEGGYFSNGWAAHIYFMGLIGFISYHMFLVLWLKRQGIGLKWLLTFLLVDAIILQGEGFLSHPFFLGLPFLIIINIKKKEYG